MGYKYKLSDKLKEMSTSGGAGGYLTKYAFAKKVKAPVELEKLGYTPLKKHRCNFRTRSKAGPEGVKDNYYVKKFQYKLVPKDKKETTCKKALV